MLLYSATTPNGVCVCVHMHVTAIVEIYDQVGLF